MLAAIPGIAQGVIGGIQAIVGAGKARRAQKQLEKMQTPSYGGSQSIMDYYNTALKRYNTSPYQSQQYQYATDQAKQGTAAGIGALQDRRSALGGIGKLVGGQQDANIRAGIAAENERQQNFGALGNATSMKAGDERMQFQQNQVAPFEKKYNLLSMKAGAANQTANAGMANIMGGLGSITDYAMINKMYGSGGGGGGGATGTSGNRIPADPWNGTRGRKINYGDINSSYPRIGG